MVDIKTVCKCCGEWEYCHIFEMDEKGSLRPICNECNIKRLIKGENEGDSFYTRASEFTANSE